RPGPGTTPASAARRRARLPHPWRHYLPPPALAVTPAAVGSSPADAEGAVEGTDHVHELPRRALAPARPALLLGPHPLRMGLPGRRGRGRRARRGRGGADSAHRRTARGVGRFVPLNRAPPELPENAGSVSAYRRAGPRISNCVFTARSPGGTARTATVLHGWGSGSGAASGGTVRSA